MPKSVRRPGELIVVNSSRRLPRAQERVRRMLVGSPVEDALRLFGRPGQAVYPRAVLGRSVSLSAIERARSRRPLPNMVSRAKPFSFKSMHGLSIRVPSRVLFCVRRKFRREVLFAHRVAGRRGVGRGRRWRRTEESNYTC